MIAVKTELNSDFAKKHNIDHLPSKQWCANGKCTPYTGGLAHEDIINFILLGTDKIDSIPCSEVATKTLQKDILHISAVYFGDRENALFKTYQHALGRSKRDIHFYQTEASCAPEHKLSTPAIALYRDFDKSPIEWKGEGTDGEATLPEWLNKMSMPHLFELTDEYA